MDPPTSLPIPRREPPAAMSAASPPAVNYNEMSNNVKYEPSPTGRSSRRATLLVRILRPTCKYDPWIVDKKRPRRNRSYRRSRCRTCTRAATAERSSSRREQRLYWALVITNHHKSMYRRTTLSPSCLSISTVGASRVEGKWMLPA